jgi:hypothetical protein
MVLPHAADAVFGLSAALPESVAIYLIDPIRYVDVAFDWGNTDIRWFSSAFVQSNSEPGLF